MLDRLAAELAEMAAAMRDEPTMDKTLTRVLQYATETIDCDHAGVLMVRSGRIETAAMTDPLVEELDRLQMEFGEGPCLETIWEHDSYLGHDTATDPRWPRWGSAVAELGIRSVLSIRLAESGRTFGALDLFARATHHFDQDDVAVGHIFGRHAAVALANAREEESLAQAVDARHLIGVAQGILMERYGLDVDQAFAVLRRYSQQRNLKLREVARQVVEGHGLPTQDTR